MDNYINALKSLKRGRGRGGEGRGWRGRRVRERTEMLGRREEERGEERKEWRRRVK